MTQKKLNTNKAKSLSRRLTRIGLIIIIGFIFLVMVLGGVFYFYKDTIYKELLLSLNEKQKGEISFSDISFSPFVHFPSASIHLIDFVYLEARHKDSIQLRDTIASMKDVYAAIHISDLISGQINVSKVTLSNGQLNLNKNSDGTINLMNAIESPQPDTLVLQQDSTDTSTQSKSGKLDLNLDGIVLKNIVCKFKNLTPSGYAQININEVKASVQFHNDSLNIGLLSEFQLKDLQYNNKVRLDNKILQINSNVVYDIQRKLLQISIGEIIFSDLDFNVSGEVDFSEKQEIDLMIKGDLKDVQLFKLLLSDYGLQNLKSGESYFNGIIKGSFVNSIPLLEFTFGLKNINLDIPEVNNSISNLNLDGYFNSGTKADFSEAHLEIKKLKGKLPGGHINGTLKLDNLVMPEVEYLFDIETNIGGFDDIFNIADLDSLQGHIKIYDEFTGSYNPTSKFFDEDISNSTIVLDSLSFIIPGFIDMKWLDGKLSRMKDTLKIYELDINMAHTDLIINGYISNLFDLITQQKKEICAEINMVSDTFDIPNLFAFEPIVGRSFPYRVLNMDLDFYANTTSDKLFNFDFVPEINIEIKSMDATIEDLFPPVSILEGDILMKDKEERIYLEFNDFILDAVHSKLHAQVSYFSPPVDPDIINVEVNISDLNPGKLFFYDQDSLPAMSNGLINGLVKANFEIGLDTLDFETFHINTEKLSYRIAEDTLNLNQLSVQANTIFIGEGSKEKPLSELSFDAELKASRINSSKFDFEKVDYDIMVQNGIFTIYPEKTWILGKEGKGIYRLSPFAEIPTYELKYSVNNFQVKDILSNMMSDTLLVGFMDLDMEIILTEAVDGNIFSGMDGFINVSGKDMTLYGVDIDNVIKKYNRSQKFNLVDIGAVALAGPIGLAVTKGSDFARLAIGGKGESSHIVDFISEWDMDNGKMILKDVAFSTKENLIAGKGWIDMASDSLEVTIGVLDKNGCSVLSQTLYGALNNPEYSELQIVSTMLGSVTNLIKDAIGKDCEVVYTGKITHPTKKSN